METNNKRIKLKKVVSVILPTYNEQENLTVFYDRIASVTSRLTEYDFEFVFVDDCSLDETPYILAGLKEKDQRVQVIRFAKNFGSHAAVAAGLHYCGGGAAIMLATDLQDPPEIIPQLIEHWEKGYEVVWGIRERRESEKLFTLVCSRIFYFLMNRLTDVHQSSTGADVFLIGRKVIDAFRGAAEKNASIYMLIAWLGFSQTSIKYVKKPRHAGSSNWTLSKRLKAAFDSLVSFSYVPLRLMSLMGVISAFIGFIYGVIVFLNALEGNPIQGWSSLMIIVLLLGGFQMSMVGILGEYLWRTYDESRGRPMYVVEKNSLSNDSVDRELIEKD